MPEHHVGDPVVPTTSDFGPGYVVDWVGGPGGEHIFAVRSADGDHTMSFREEELAPGPPAPEHAVGSTVRLFGTNALIVARTSDTYAVEIVRPRLSGLVFRHHYESVPAWVLALGYA